MLDWTFAEDLRPAPGCREPQVTATGERFWVLRVNLYQGVNWPVDCVTRLLLWEAQDGTLQIEHGKYWPANNDHESDGA